MIGMTPHYTVAKQFFHVHTQDTIVISGRGEEYKLEGHYYAMVIPKQYFSYEAFHTKYEHIMELDAHKGTLSIPYHFEEEQAYEIRVAQKTPSGMQFVFGSEVYALEDDLYHLLPLKGDLHMHTTCSDGRESPELVVYACRRSGCDFIAVTDHNAYEGSVAAEDVTKRSGCRLCVLRGEEFSSDFTPMHIISLGAPSPVDRAYYHKGIELTDGVKQWLAQAQRSQIRSDHVAYACTQNLFDAIRENGGLSIMCHPLWRLTRNDNGQRLDVSLDLVLDLLHTCNFDGFEIVSGSPMGQSYNSVLQANLYREIVSPHKEIFVTGITDSHTYSCDPIAGKHFTIVFAEENTPDAILYALSHARSVAVDITQGGDALCFGPFRLCCFAYYLLAHYFPERDKVAYAEGERLIEKYRQDHPEP